MPIPSTSITTLDRQLGTFFEASLDEMRDEFIANLVMPIMNVAQQSWTFKKIPLEELLRLDPDLRRTPGAGYKRSITQFTEDSYSTTEYGFEEPIDDREAAMYGDFLNAAAVATQRITHAVLTAQEMRVAALVMDVTTYTGSGSLNQAVQNGQWSTLATSTPLNDVRVAGDKMFANAGYYPDTVVINRKVFRTLQQNADVRSAIASSGAGDPSKPSDVTRAMLAQVFNVNRVLVAGGGKNTAALNATPAISHIWGNHCMLLKTAMTNDIQEPCIGRQFHWTGDGSSASGTLEAYYEPAIRGEVVRVRQDIAEKRMYTEMGVMIPNCIA